MIPPFLTASFRSASAAVVPGAPTVSSPMDSRISAIESPTAGVGASERSTIPYGMPRRLDASCATSWPSLVTLNAVFLMVSQSSPNGRPFTLWMAWLMTPGPETPTLMTSSVSVTPWKAPAMNGLSSGALHSTTSLAQPRESRSAVRCAVSLMIRPMSFTASMLIPVLVDPRLTDAQTRSVFASALGMDLISSSSDFVIPLAGRAEKPPRKFTPTSVAALSSVMAMRTKSSSVWQADAPIRAIGVTEMRLLTMGMAYSRSIAFPVATRSFAVSVMRR